MKTCRSIILPELNMTNNLTTKPCSIKKVVCESPMTPEEVLRILGRIKTADDYKLIFRILAHGS